MKLTAITPADRKAKHIGAAVRYRLDIEEHMGGGMGAESVWCYLGDAQVFALADAIDAAATLSRDAVLALLWSELDAVVDRLFSDPMDPDALPDALLGGSDVAEEFNKFLSWAEDRGKAQGLAYAIAVLVNPRNPDVDAIRAEAVTRHAE